jgi:hypothetical protein
MEEQHFALRELIKLSTESKGAKLYALVDGIQYDRKNDEELNEETGICSLFSLPEDKKLAFAGPWLLDMAELPETWFLRLGELEKKLPAVSWIISEHPFLSLARHLGTCMMVTLPGKQAGIFRFYDCRVLKQIPVLLSPDQMMMLMKYTREWMFLHDGKVESYQHDSKTLI